MNSATPSAPVVSHHDVEVYNQIYHLHPHVAFQPEQSAEDLLNHLYPPIDPFTLPMILHNQMSVMQQPQMSMMAMNYYLPPHLVSATPLALFRPGNHHPRVQESQKLTIQSGTPSDAGSTTLSTTHQYLYWLPYSIIWGEQGLENITPPHPIPHDEELAPHTAVLESEDNDHMQIQDDVTAPDQPLIEFPEHFTRILRIFGPAETVNAEYLEWFWVRKFRFQLEHVNNKSPDSAMGDIEFRFATEDQAKMAYYAMGDPEFAETTLEAIMVEFRPEP